MVSDKKWQQLVKKIEKVRDDIGQDYELLDLEVSGTVSEAFDEEDGIDTDEIENKVTEALALLDELIKCLDEIDTLMKDF